MPPTITEAEVKVLIKEEIAGCKKDEGAVLSAMDVKIDKVYGRLWSLAIIGVMQILAVAGAVIVFLANRVMPVASAAVK